MVSFTKTALAAISLFTSLASADCAFNILNINGAVMGTGCARMNGQGTLTLPDFGPATFTVRATGSCGLSITGRQSRFPASAFDGWTVGSAGRCTIGGGGGGGGGGAPPTVPPVIAPPPVGGPVVPVLPPGGNSGGKSGKNNPRKCDRERCSGKQGCCTQPVGGSCPFRKECNNYPCDSCCGIPEENWTACSFRAIPPKGS